MKSDIIQATYPGGEYPIYINEGLLDQPELIRQHVPFIAEDCYMAPLMEKVRLLVHGGEIKQAIEDALASPTP